MSEKKRRTGLGKNAFFSNSHTENAELEDTQVSMAQSNTAEVASQKPTEPKLKKVRTTVSIYPETLASMELLKVEARKQGIKATLSDVLKEAVDMLMESKGLTV